MLPLAPVLLVLAFATPAFAQEAAERTAVNAPRDPSDYRGRTNEVTVEEALAWIPRILFFPVHLLTEYVLRVPLYAFISWAERERLLEWIALIIHPAPGLTWHPTLSLETGFAPVVGLTMRWRDVLVRGHEARVSFSFGATELWWASFRDRWQLGPVTLGVRTGFSTRADRPFYGIGPYAAGIRTNYTERRAEAHAFLGAAHESHVRAQVSVGYTDEVVGPGNVPSMETQFDPNAIPGVGRFALAVGSIDLALDTRARLEENGGVRFAALATAGADTEDPARAFVTWRAELEGALEVSYPDRVLAARVLVADSAELGPIAMPFTYLPVLGGDDHRGFAAGRWRGGSAIMAELRYRYPVAYFLDFQILASAGNVFARHFEDFTFEALTASFGFGLRTRRTGEEPIDFTVAFGTTRFDGDFALEGIRVSLATTQSL